MAHMVDYDKMWSRKAAKGYKTIGKMFKGALGLGALLFSSTSSTTKTSKSTTRKTTTKSRSNTGRTKYTTAIESAPSFDTSDLPCPGIVDLTKLDPIFNDVARYVVTRQEGSTSRLQRAFDLGYNRAGKLSDQLEAAGIVGPNKGPKGRDVLIQSLDELEQKLQELQKLKNEEIHEGDKIDSPVNDVDIHSTESTLTTLYGIVDLKRLDPMFADVARYVVTRQEGSTSRLQRAFDLGYNRAGKLSDQLEAAGIVGPNKGSKGRDVLIQSLDELDKKLQELNLL